MVKISGQVLHAEAEGMGANLPAGLRRVRPSRSLPTVINVQFLSEIQW